MYITAQRVLNRKSQASAINAFYYKHKTSRRKGQIPDTVPEDDPGELVSSSVLLPPGGNEVLSFLDIVCDDDTDIAELASEFLAFVESFKDKPPPFSKQVGTCLFRFNIILGLAPAWKHEIKELYDHAVSLTESPSRVETSAA